MALPYLLWWGVAADAGASATTGASYLGEHYDRLGRAHKKAKELRRKAEERLWETARHTYRRIHGLIQEAPEAVSEAILEEVKEVVSSAVRPSAITPRFRTPPPSSINWTALAAQAARVERLVAILEQIEAARLADEDEDDWLLLIS
jgi:hypothetical protein